MANSGSKPKNKNNVKLTPTSAGSWKGKRSVEAFDLALPSGNVCRMRSLSVAEMIGEGILVDSLLPVVQGHIDKGQGKRPKDYKPKAGTVTAADAASEEQASVGLLTDPAKMAEMFNGMDKAVAKLVLEPTVHYHRREVKAEEIPGIVTTTWETIPTEERDQDALYTDEVDLEDKMFIFNFMLGGSADHETFRGEAGKSLDGLQNGVGRTLPAE